MRAIYTSLLFVCLSITTSAQTVRYVAVGGTGAGTSWADASGDLAGIMAAATAGTEIWVRQGTYYPTTCAGTCTQAEREASFEMRPGVSIIGGFVGTESSRLAANASNITVLSGDIGLANDATDNSYTVVYAQGVGVNAGLQNFTVTAGNANKMAAGGFTERGRAGAALYINGSGFGTISNPIITDCRFISNASIGRGGAVYCNGFGGETSPLFRFCEFAFNSAFGDGGAIAVDGTGGTTNLKFADCLIRDNGTVYNAGTSQSGGAVFIAASSATAVIDFDRCALLRNATDVATPTSPTGNSSANGGAIYVTSGNASGGTLVINARNTVFANNTAFSAGAIYNLGGVTTLTGVTVANNRALGLGGSGGGLYINAGVATVVNSIFWGNQVVQNPFGGKDVRFVNGSLNISYSLVEATNQQGLFSRANINNSDNLNAGPGMIYGTDPMFSYGGTVPELQATSPAVNAGDNNSATTQGGDFSGGARIRFGTVDLGAVESNSAPLPVELIEFVAEAEGQAVRVEWLVASEDQLASYRIERSSTGEDFAEIGEVLAMGAGQYGFDDRAVVAGERYYYRLRSVDFDGSDYLSAVVTVQLENAATDMALFSRIYPNPTAGELRVTLLPRQQARTVYATVIDLTGRKLRMWPLTTDGEHILPLDDLPSAQYIVRLTEGDREQTAAFTVAR